MMAYNQADDKALFDPMMTSFTEAYVHHFKCVK